MSRRLVEKDLCREMSAVTLREPTKDEKQKYLDSIRTRNSRKFIQMNSCGIGWGSVTMTLTAEQKAWVSGLMGKRDAVASLIRGRVSTIARTDPLGMFSDAL
jgi:hypothetical protein